MDPRHLNNFYYVLRHGKSLANVRNLIVSHPDNGVADFGLSPTGKAQVHEAFSVYADAKDLDTQTLILSSDFLRARQTAEIAARILGCKTDITLTPLLRERFFGTWELTGSENYDRVWADDAEHKTDQDRGVESADHVLERGLACIKEAESSYAGRTILLVSHGDTLQILMTFFAGWPPFRHRELSHLETAEIRRLAV